MNPAGDPIKMFFFALFSGIQLVTEIYQKVFYKIFARKRFSPEMEKNTTQAH